MLGARFAHISGLRLIGFFYYIGGKRGDEGTGMTREQATGNRGTGMTRQQGTGNREQGDGDDEATGNRQQGTGRAAAARPAYGGSQEEMIDTIIISPCTRQPRPPPETRPCLSSPKSLPLQGKVAAQRADGRGSPSSHQRPGPDRRPQSLPLQGKVAARRADGRGSPSSQQRPKPCLSSPKSLPLQGKVAARRADGRGSPSSQQRPCPDHRPPKAFPFRGRWQPEGLTEEVLVISISSILMRRNPPHPTPKGQRKAVRQIPLRHVRPGDGALPSATGPFPCSLFPYPSFVALYTTYFPQMSPSRRIGPEIGSLWRGRAGGSAGVRGAIGP